MTLWDIYNDAQPTFLSRMKMLGAVNAEKFLKKLREEKSIENFNATISEFLFCEFFQKVGYTVQYEKKFTHSDLARKYIPDITISQSGENILVEVVQLNSIQPEIDAEHFFQYFFNRRTDLKHGYNLEIHLHIHKAELPKYEKSKILSELDIWLGFGREVDETYVVDENLSFRIIKKTNNSNIGFMYRNMVKFDIRRVFSALKKKAMQHSALLEKISLPFFICLKTNIETAITEEDLFYVLYGDTIENIDLNIFRSELNGLFYDEKIAENLAGVILMINSSVFFFQNFNNLRLKISPRNLLISKQYSMRDLKPSKIEWLEKTKD